MKMKTIIMLTVVCVVTASLLIYQDEILINNNLVVNAENTTPNKEKAQAIVKTPNVLVKQDKTFLENLEKQHPKTKVAQSETPQKLLTKSFKRMHAMGNYFRAEQLQRDEIQILLQDNKNLELAKNILLDLSVTKKEFGESQALARIYAIKMLAEQARLGDLQPLYDVTSSLAEQLNQKINQGGEIANGQEHDLESLLTVAVNRENISDLEDSNNVAALLESTGFHSDMSEKIVGYYDNAVFFPLLSKFGRKKASEIVGQVIVASNVITNEN
jgi:hypothetical protein